MPEKLKGICRLCLSKERFMFPIFRRDTKSDTPFRIKLLSCASVEVFADDGLPSEICHICAHQVEKSFEFRTICQNSDATLRSQLHEDENRVLQDSVTLDHSELNDEWSGKKRNLSSGESGDLMYFSSNKTTDPSKGEMGLFICFACSLDFMSHDKLIEHLLGSHPSITLFPCMTCKLHFLDISEFRAHLNLKHAFNCTLCDYSFKHQKNLELHLKQHSTEVFSCSICKKSFDKSYDLKKHELIHLEKMCRYCLKVCNTDEEYHDHMKICSEVYSCKLCSQMFQLKKDLIEHVNNFHENAQVHKCINCNIRFDKWDDLEQHVCKSKSEFLTCKYCQQTFNQASLLEAHVSKEHNYESFVCKFCPKSFPLKSALKRHEKSHSGVKPYQCKYCPRKFKDNTTCIVHIRTHTGERPFQCQECDKDFKQLANLKMHTFRHHKINNKVKDEKTEILREADQIYNELCSTSIISNYSPDESKSFQQIDTTISTGFNETTNMLITEH